MRAAASPIYLRPSSARSTARSDQGLEPGTYRAAAIFIDSRGDLDRDGITDFLVGSGSAENGAGVVRLYSTRTRMELAKLVGARAGDRFGASVAGGADFDGDARPDFVIGAPGAAGLVRGGGAGEASLWSSGPLGGLVQRR